MKRFLALLAIFILAVILYLSATAQQIDAARQLKNLGAALNALIGGDMSIASNGTATVTKTGGVSFATSATTDTTNASNITSGTLSSGRFSAVQSLNSITGAVTIVAGSNITATPSGQNITIASTVGGGAIYPGFTFPPLSSAFTANNGGALTVTDATNRLVVRSTPITGWATLGLTAALTAPFTVDMCSIGQNGAIGLGLYPLAAAAAGLDVEIVDTTGSDVFQSRSVLWTVVTTGTGAVSQGPNRIMASPIQCFRATNDSTNEAFYTSANAIDWTLINSLVLATGTHPAIEFAGPDSPAPQGGATWTIVHFAKATAVCGTSQDIIAGVCTTP